MVPWDAPEAVIEMNSPDLISLETFRAPKGSGHESHYECS